MALAFVSPPYTETGGVRTYYIMTMSQVTHIQPMTLVEQSLPFGWMFRLELTGSKRQGGSGQFMLQAEAVKLLTKLRD